MATIGARDIQDAIAAYGFDPLSISTSTLASAVRAECEPDPFEFGPELSFPGFEDDDFDPELIYGHDFWTYPVKKHDPAIRVPGCSCRSCIPDSVLRRS